MYFRLARLCQKASALIWQLSLLLKTLGRHTQCSEVCNPLNVDNCRSCMLRFGLLLQYMISNAEIPITDFMKS